MYITLILKSGRVHQWTSIIDVSDLPEIHLNNCAAFVTFNQIFNTELITLKISCFHI
jgi:hypothetical protein